MTMTPSGILGLTLSMETRRKTLVQPFFRERWHTILQCGRVQTTIALRNQLFHQVQRVFCAGQGEVVSKSHCGSLQATLRNYVDEAMRTPMDCVNRVGQ